MAKNPKIQKEIIICLFLFFCLFSCFLLAQDTRTADNETNPLYEAQDEVLYKGPIHDFFARIDERKDYRYLLAFIFPLFLIMAVLPFLPAILELVRKKDDQPLYVNMDYSKDPRYFDHSFRDKLLANVKNVDQDRAFRVTLSKNEEVVEVCNAANVDDYKFGKNVLFLEGNADITTNMKFLKEVYVTGTTKLHENTILRGILSENDLKIAPHSTIVRWAGSEANIFVGYDCNLGVRCSCEKELWIDLDCEFKSLYGHPIFTHYDENAVLMKINEDQKDEIESEKDSFITKETNLTRIEFDESSDPLARQNIGEEEKEDELRTISDSCIVVRKGESTIPLNSKIDKDIIIKTDAFINRGTLIHGTIKCYGTLEMDDNVTVEGNIFAEKSIKIGANCRIWGDVFSQGSVYIGANTEIGSAGKDKSVIGKHKIRLCRNVKIHGYLLTEGGGKTVMSIGSIGKKEEKEDE